MLQTRCLVVVCAVDVSVAPGISGKAQIAGIDQLYRLTFFVHIQMALLFWAISPRNGTKPPHNRLFAVNFGWVGFLVVCFVSYIKSTPTHEKVFAVGKSGPNAAFNLFFCRFWVDLGLGEFVGFVIIFVCFPTIVW